MGYLKQFHIFDSGALPAVHGWGSSEWTNPGPVKLIGKTYMWIGCSVGTKMDIHFDLRRKSDGAIIDLVQWDHYDDPIMPSHRGWESHSPGWEIDSGDGVDFNYFCSGDNIGGIVKKVHYIGILSGTL